MIHQKPPPPPSSEPRVASRETKRLASSSPHASAAPHPLSDSVSSPASSQPSQKKKSVRTTNTTSAASFPLHDPIQEFCTASGPSLRSGPPMLSDVAFDARNVPLLPHTAVGPHPSPDSVSSNATASFPLHDPVQEFHTASEPSLRSGPPMLSDIAFGIRNVSLSPQTAVGPHPSPDSVSSNAAAYFSLHDPIQEFRTASGPSPRSGPPMLSDMAFGARNVSLSPHTAVGPHPSPDSVSSNAAAYFSLHESIQESRTASEPSLRSGLPMLSVTAFGARKWKQYMGVAVDEEPPLPSNIDEILNAECPFLLNGEWKPQKVRDNHVLVLIPARVNGEPFTLDKLGALIKARAFPRNEYGYDYYSHPVREEVGSKPLPQTPYWILLTKDVMKDSSGKNHSAHEAMIKEHDGYSMPHALEAATAVLMHYARSGEYLYSRNPWGEDPWGYTRCREKVDSNDSSVFVGAFASSGLNIAHDFHFEPGEGGVSACRRLEKQLLKIGKRKRSASEEYESTLQSQQVAQPPIELKLRAKPKMKELEQAQATANWEQGDHTMPYAMAFGAREWKQYMGVAVGEEPPLPTDIDKILDANCSFLLNGENTPQKVRDNHVLVLIPARVNGEAFTLDKLGALVKAKVFPQNEYGYDYYSDPVREEVGDKPLTQTSYWILLTKDVMKDSSGKNHSAHEAMIKEHDGYSMPHTLEAVTAVLMHYARSGEYLYGRDPRGEDPWGYTRCREKVDSNDSSVFVGAFASPGLNVAHDFHFEPGESGVAGCRKL